MLWTIIFFIGLALFCASLGFLLHAMLERNHRRLLFVILTLVSYGVALYGGVQAIDEYKIRHAIKERAAINALKELTPQSGKHTTNTLNPPK